MHYKMHRQANLIDTINNIMVSVVVFFFNSLKDYFNVPFKEPMNYTKEPSEDIKVGVVYRGLEK